MCGFLRQPYEQNRKEALPLRICILVERERRMTKIYSPLGDDKHWGEKAGKKDRVLGGGGSERQIYFK